MWMEQLERLIQQKHMLTHPFYQAWTCGMLSKTTLQDYAKEYYHHVKAFPTYLSTLHSHCEDISVRKMILDNLIDEEAGNPNHPDLWRTFALSLGVTNQELDNHKPKAATEALIKTFRESCMTSLAAGMTALYCYESQIPAICQTKIDGLKKWYGMTNPEGYHYFTVHETADVEHSKAEKQALGNLVKPGEEVNVLKEAEKILDSLSNFLSSFH